MEDDQGGEGDKVKVVVTAGPTREFIDPVRFLSNPSTGKMGFAVAAEAARRGFDVVLVAGPVSLKTPVGVNRIDVVSAREMLKAVKGAVAGSDPCVFVSTAAVADFRPGKCAAQKLKKGSMDGVLRLVRNPDILKTVGLARKKAREKFPILVGFAAETGDAVAEAVRKCRAKHLDMVVANDVTEKGAGFGTNTNKVVFVFPDGSSRRLPLMSKRRVAKKILDEATRLTTAAR